MLSDQSLLEISEILGSFDLKEIESFVNNQILNEDDILAPGTDTIDHFHPLYIEYRRIINSTDDPEVLEAVNQRFFEVCDIFLKAIESKYCIKLNDDWKEDNLNDIAAVTVALYTFFVINHQDNLEEMLYNYIISHKKEIYTNFESLRSKKDASTISNKKKFSTEMAVIFANIYDVCTYILEHISPSEFFENIDQDYVPLKLIKTLYDEGNLGGVYGDDYPLCGKDFTDCISEEFRDNSSYKAVICFELLDRLKRWFEKSQEK